MRLQDPPSVHNSVTFISRGLTVSLASCRPRDNDDDSRIYQLYPDEQSDVIVISTNGMFD